MKKASTAIPNQALLEVRLQSGWSQKEVAEKLNTTPQNVCRWERGLTHPSAHFRHQLSVLYQKDQQTLGLEGTGSIRHSEQVQEIQSSLLSHPKLVSSTAPVWFVPIWRNPFFTGRETILEQLHSYFQENPTMCFQVLGGVNGSGKTQIALEFAYRFRDDYQDVIWIRAETYETVMEDISRLFAKCSDENTIEHDDEKIVKLAEQWLAIEQKRLIILDGVNASTIFTVFQRSPCSAHFLITCNTHIIDLSYSFVRLIYVDRMDAEEGALLLLRYTKNKRLYQPDDPIEAEQFTMSQLIVQELRGVPLALVQASSYMRETGCRLEEYLLYCKQYRSEFLHFHGKIITNSASSIADTLLQTIASVEREKPTAIAFMRLCAILSHHIIPEELVINAVPILDPTIQAAEERILAFHTIIKALIFVFFLRRDLDTRTLHLHPLVLDVLREHMDEEQRCIYTKQAVCMIRHVDLTPNLWKRVLYPV